MVKTTETRCEDCNNEVCGCVIHGGNGIDVSGAGTANDPYIIGVSEKGIAGVIVGYMRVDPIGAVPPGWLLCNGQAVSRGVFSDLYAAIGINYGDGDGVSTFNVPNLVGRIPLGSDPQHPLGSRAGQETVSVGVEQLPPHIHTTNHDHPAFNGGTESDWHYHSFDHGHPDIALTSPNVDTTGAHQHFITYIVGVQGNMLSRVKRDPTGVGGSAPPLFSSAGAHFHHVTTVTGIQYMNTGAQDRFHYHTIGAPYVVVDSGAGDNLTTPATFNNLPPYLTVRFIIAT